MVSSNQPGSSTDWPSVVFDPAFMAGLDRMAAKRFVQPALAEEAVTAMIEALSENQWQRLSRFSGKSQPSTFAYSVAGRAWRISPDAVLVGRARRPGCKSWGMPG